MIDYYDLGATLYIPILQKNLKQILEREKYPFLKSIVICLEDSTALCDIPKAMELLEGILKDFKKSSLNVFIRPRDISNLQNILKFNNIDMIDGFALAKFDTQNMSDYLSIFRDKSHFYLMPILESIDVFDVSKLQLISQNLKPFRDKIISIRVGGEDILSLLDTMREEGETIYEIMPLYLVLSNIINTFKPKGFNISSVVYASFRDKDTLLRELKGDISHNLFNKTSIHPNQVEIIQNSYRVSTKDYIIAKELISSNRAIISHNGRMYEKTTHSNWAKSVIKRYDIYGVIDE